MAITDGLITLDDARKSIYGEKYATAPTTLDTDIERYVEAATPVIEYITGPLIVRSRTFTLDGGGAVLVLPVPFSAVTALTVNGVAFSNYFTVATEGLVYAGTTTSGTTFSAGNRNVSVTVTVGNSTIPANVKLAAKELVRFWWQQGRQANRPGVAEQDTSAPLPMGFLVPKRVEELLRASAGLGGFA